MRTLRSMIDFLKGKIEKVVEDIKRMPKVNPRGIDKISEDSIATISIEEIQKILKEDVNTVYDALIASDYIEKIAESGLPKGYNPDEYFTSITEPTEICRIDNTLGSERGTVFKINIANREVFTLFDTGASKSVLSGETFRKLNLDNKDLDTKKLTNSSGSKWHKPRSSW